MECRAVWAATDLEVRLQDKRPVISGRFPYKVLAVLSDRGRVRKETILPGAFDYALKDANREINLLLGHSFDKPLASKLSGTLELTDTENFLEFVATIPVGAERASHVMDALAMIGAGLVKGVSPGFRVPPKDVVPNAETLLPEPGNPSVFIRHLSSLVLYELSLVTRAAYETSEAELRQMQWDRAPSDTRIILP